MKIAFLGSGNVGAALATRLGDSGHQVDLAQTREGSESIARALQRTKSLTTSPLAVSIARSEVVFLATPFSAAETVLRAINPADLAGKVVVDCTNPIGPSLTHGLNSERAGSAYVQALIPGARVVKAFSIYGFENLEEPSFPGHAARPVMLFCGDDQSAKEVVASLIAECGFEPLDVGGLIQALHLEHMTLLWVRMVRVHGHSPHLVWSVLRK